MQYKIGFVDSGGKRAARHPCVLIERPRVIIDSAWLNKERTRNLFDESDRLQIQITDSKIGSGGLR